MGGALELALACHFRVAARGTRLSLPEVKLGIVPGAGGTQRLPRLVGPSTALRMMLTGEPLDADAAQHEGLIDEVCPADQLVECARRLALTAGRPVRTGQRTDKVSDLDELAGAVNRATEMLATRPAGNHRTAQNPGTRPAQVCGNLSPRDWRLSGRRSPNACRRRPRPTRFMCSSRPVRWRSSRNSRRRSSGRSARWLWWAWAPWAPASHMRWCRAAWKRSFSTNNRPPWNEAVSGLPNRSRGE